MNRRFIGALCFSVAAALLAACGASQSLTTQGARSARKLPLHHWRSESALLYASRGDGKDNAVYVLSYPRGNLVGSGAIADDPYASCSDTLGNVFVVGRNQSGSSDVYEFAHGGTTPIDSLSDSGKAIDCAVDAKSGNLAVVNYYDDDAPGGPGPDVAIYAGAQGPPTLYGYAPFFQTMFSGTFDSGGNLFVSGIGSTGFRFAELPYGDPSMIGINLDADINTRNAGQSIRWSGQYVVITSVPLKNAASKVYLVTVSGSDATVKRISTLKSRASAKRPRSAYFAISGSRLAVPTRGGIGLWAFPKGGAQKNNLTAAGSGFHSVTVSP